MNSFDIRALNEQIERQSAFVTNLQTGMAQVIVGQKHLVESLLIGLLSDGHVLLEGVPGLAKTQAIKTLASLVDAQFSRIQFTPDLLPADVIGTMIYSQKEESFQVEKGPVFANFVLADEINRAPAKVQSALLEAMQERQVTIGKETFQLPKPFLVLATQNPIEQEGTYPLPEAQVDRFMLKVIIDYPKLEEEKLIVRQNIKGEAPAITPLMSTQEIMEARAVVRQVYLDEKIEQYIADIVALIRSYQSLPSNPKVYVALPATIFKDTAPIRNFPLEENLIAFLMEAAKQTGADVIDVHEATKDAGAHFSDKVHPSDDEGRKIIAQTVADAILEDE